jgi:hypothetical protein
MNKRYSSLEDHYNMMFGWRTAEEEEKEEEGTRFAAALKSPVRPVSWHPGSFRAPEYTQSPVDSLPSQGQMNWQLQSLDIGDAASQMSGYPFFRKPPTSHHHSFHSGYASSAITPAVDSYNTSPIWDNASVSRHESMTDYPSANSDQFHDVQPASWSVPDWVQMTQSTTKPSLQNDSDFLPIQHPPPPEEQDMKSDAGESEESGEVLVGMGLYDDPPEGYDSWFASESRPTQGKGLKLEETWEPPEPEEEDDDSDDAEDEADGDAEDAEDAEKSDNDADDVSSSPKSVEEPPLPAPPGLPTEQQQWSMNQPSTFPINMSGQSFFFDEDENYTTEWWFHQLKQHVPQTGLGYGWL